MVPYLWDDGESASTFVFFVLFVAENLSHCIEIREIRA